ncbi:hypothetical protein FRC11_006081, partial [Ceratobasidium sp. 423]
VLDQQAQLDDTVHAILRSLIRLPDMVNTLSQASTATAVNRLKEPIEGILGLLEDVSIYMFNRYGTNDLARIPPEDAEVNQTYDVEACLARLEELQRAFHDSWPPAATSSIHPANEIAGEFSGTSRENGQTIVDRSTRTADPYGTLNQLKPMDPSGYDPNRSCLDGTREVILNRIITWTQNRDNSEGFMWISGQAGMGKTSIATSLCQRLDHIGAFAGSFFCQRNDPESNDPLRLINNLAHEIASRCPPYAQEVSIAIHSNCTLCNAHLSLRYEGLIKRPLEKLKSLSIPTTLVAIIDGLDECGDCNSREQILRQLYDMSRVVPWLKIIITGRPVADLQGIFRRNCPDEPIVHLHKYDATPDIRAYIQGQLGELAEAECWPTGSINQLCTMSQGVFLWATLAIKYIRVSILPALPRLQKLLNNQMSPVTDHLDALYIRALKTATHGGEDEIKDAHLRCIGAILATSEHEPPTIPELQHHFLIAGQIDQLTLEQVVKNLAPLLLVLDGGRVRLHHASFKDFVTNPLRAGEFHIPLDRYLQVMQRDLRFNICGLETSHLLNSEVHDLKLRVQLRIRPALKYACMHWIDYLISSSNQTPIGAIKEFLKGPQLMYWIEVLSLLGRLDVAITGLPKLASLEPTPNDGDLIASWVRDAHRFLLSFYDAIATSTPHLYISALAFAPSKSLTAMRMRPYFPNTVTIAKGPFSSWHPCVKSIPHPQPIQSLSISPDGLRIAVGYSNGSLAIWDLQTGDRISESLMGHGGPVTCVIYSPNSNVIISSSEDTTIRVWDVANHLRTSHVLTGHSGPVYAIAFSPDASIIASGSSDKTIRLWDCNTKGPIHEPYAGHSSRVSSVAFSPDGSKLVSGSWDHTIRVWSLDLSGRRLADNPLAITGHSDSITCVAVSADGSKIASGSTDRTIQMWDSQTGEKAQCCPSPAKHSDSVTSIAFSPNGSCIVSTSLDGKVQLHNSTTLVPMSRSFGHSKSVNGIAFSPDGAYVVSGSTDMTTRIWDISKCPKPIAVVPIVGHSNAVACVAVSSDGTYIISGSYDNSIRMWDAQTGTAIGEPFVGHSSYVRSVAISPDGTRIISGSLDGSMKLWDTTTRAAIHSYQHSHVIRCTGFSPNGALIAFGADDSKAYLWDATRWTMVGNALQGHSNIVFSVAFSPDGACLASASADRTVILWDTQTHNRLGNPLSGHTNYVRSVRFSPCGTKLVSGSWDNTVRLWDRQTGNTIHILTGHSHNVYSVIFSPDGSFIASGSQDQTVRLWNAKTGQPIQQSFAGHTNAVYAVDFSPDGSYIIS